MTDRRSRGRISYIKKGDKLTAEYLNSLVKKVNLNTRNLRGPQQKKQPRQGGGRPEVPVLGGGFLLVLVPVNFIATCTVRCVGGDFTVDWGDGTPVTYTSGTSASDVPSGNITVENAAGATITFFQLTTNTYSSVDVQQSSTLTSFASTCFNLSSMTSFAMNDASNITNFLNAWRGCTGLSSFPLLDFSSAITLTAAWAGCDSLSSFPSINTSLCTSFSSSWSGCTGLTSFPTLDFSSGTNFINAFNTCNSLTSLGSLATENGNFFSGMFNACTSLTSIAAIDTTSVTVSAVMFVNTPALTSPDTATQALLESASGFDFN